MVNYECYRCGYNTKDKTKMVNHLNRKRSCACLKHNINLDECTGYILQGLSYKEYFTENKKHTGVLIACKNEPKIDNCDHSLIINKHFDSKWGKTSEKQKNTIDQKHNCKYCKKYFKHAQSLNRHIKYCSDKKNDDLVKKSMTELVNILNLITF